MEEIKSHFTLDGRGGNIGTNWFLIDSDESLKAKTQHIVCLSLHAHNVYYRVKDNNLKYILEKDDLLPKPSLSTYFDASDVLKENGLRYNKKKGIIEERKSPQQ